MLIKLVKHIAKTCFITRGFYIKSRKSEQLKKAEAFILENFSDYPAIIRKKHAVDMVWSQYYFGISFPEYFQFHFMKKGKRCRGTFVGNDERREVFTKRLNSRPEILNDKFATYERFKNYYRREVCVYKNDDDIQKVREFVERHRKFITKPLNKNKGKGVKFWETHETKLSECIEKVLKEYNNWGGGIA